MRRIACVIALVSASASGATATSKPAPSPKDVARVVDAYAKPLQERGDLSGQLLILRSGTVVVERSFGMADRERGVPVSPETRFNIASVTKPMTVNLAIQLIQEKKLGVQDPISRWFPDFPKGDSITVSLLLRHRSGIPHELMPDSVMTHPFTAEELVTLAKRLPLDFSPGARESYSSGGFEVLARILELAGGKSYSDLVEEIVFHPLGMVHSINQDSRPIPDRAQDYLPGATGLEKAPSQDFSGLVGAGSVWSTARDLHLFVRAIATGARGEGLRQSYVRDGQLEFNGRTAGFKAWAVWDSTSDVEAIFTSNVSSGAPDALKRDVLRLASGEAVAPPALPPLRKDPLPPAELRAWEGEYQIEHGPHISLKLKNGALYASDWILLPAQDGSMFCPRDYGIVRRVNGPDGNIVRLDWTQGSDTYPAPRVGNP